MVTCVFCIQARAGKEHSRSLKFHTFDVRIEPFDFNGLICLVLFIIVCEADLEILMWCVSQSVRGHVEMT